MLGEFFAARESEIDDELLEAPYVRLETVEAKGLTPRRARRFGVAARRWIATEELRMDEWQFEDGERLLREVSALARPARDKQRELWYWWSR